MRLFLSITILILTTCTCFSQQFSTGPFTFNTPADASNIQWFKDGSPIASETGATYSTSAVGVYWAIFDNVVEGCTGLNTEYFIVEEENSSTNTTFNGPSGQVSYTWVKSDSTVSTDQSFSVENTEPSVGTYLLNYDTGSCLVTGDSIHLFIVDVCNSGEAGPVFSF